MLDLRLYLLGTSAQNNRLVAGLETVLRAHKLDYELSVRDVLEHLSEAMLDGVYATPTLIKRSPAPKARVIGHLIQSERVLRDLQISEQLEP
jgi:circadian clock protein KaiB